MADRTVKVRLVADIGQYRAAMQQAAKTSADFGREINAGTKKANDALSGMGRGAMLAGAGLLTGFALAGRAAMGFDQQMSAVAAATMATAGEMDALRQAALDAGQATAFSATESAAAIENLAKAGISTADILSGALAGSLDLAAAGGLDVAQAAEIAATALTQFNLSGGDVSHVADLLAAGAGKAQGDVTDLGMALKQSGLVAAQTGLTIEETTGALAAFASAGLLGSDAGTSLKTMLQRLTPMSGEASEKMADLGFSAYDAQGNFIGLTALAGEMQDSFGDLTVEQRNLAMATIFGADAVRAASVLFNEGADGVAKWQEEVNDAGYAAEQAEIRMDNLAGDLEQLGGALETALINGGSKATGVLRFLTQAATDGVNAFSEMPSVVQGGVAGIAGLGGAALAAGGAIAWALPKWYKFTDTIFELGPAGQKAASGLNKLASASAVAVGVTALATAVNMVQDALSRPEGRSAAKLAEDLLEFASSGNIAGEAAAAFGDDLEGLAHDAAVAMTDLSSINESTLPGDWRQGKEDIEALDSALASLVGSGGGRQAREVFELLADSLEGTGISADELAGILPGYTDALADSGVQSRIAADGAEEVADGLDGVAGAADLAAEGIKNYMDAQRASIDPLFGMLDAINSNRDAQNSYLDSLDALNDAQANYDEVLADSASTSEDVEDAQRELRDALIGVDDAQQGVAQSALDVHQASIDLAGAVQNGTVSVGDAQAMLASWVDQGLLTAEQAWAVAGSFEGVAAKADALEGRNVQIAIGANTDSAWAKIRALELKLQQLANTNIPVVVPLGGPVTRKASGGLIPGVGDGDTVPAMLTPGEFVIRKSAVQALGVDRLNMLNRADMLRHYAVGGPVQAGHLAIAHQSTMLGNLSGTTVGRNITADHKGDPAGARQDLLKLLDLYNELVETLGVAVANELVFASTGLDGFETLAEGALGFADSLKEIAAEQARVAAEHESIHDVMFAVGDLSTDEYLAMLNGRLAATEKYSDEWYDVWQQINRITEDAAAEEQELLDKAREERERAFEQQVSELSSVYQQAQQQFEQQQQDYADAVSERSQRILDETRQFRDDIVGTFRDLVNPVDIFGGADNVTAAGVEAALQHRVDAAAKFGEVFAQLAAKGIDQSVLTDLAQGGPDNLSLANALLEVDPELVNAALASTAAVGGGVADIALGWEGARIQQQAYADIALPAQQSFNDLLDAGLRLRDEQAARDAEAEAWARRMATDGYPQLADSLGTVADEAERYLLAVSSLTAVSGMAGPTATWAPVFNIRTAPVSEGGMTEQQVYAALDAVLEQIAGAEARGVH